jgi:peptide/nickel transport system substrate-binding protein
MVAKLFRTLRHLVWLAPLAILLSATGACAQDRASTLRVQLGGNLGVFDPIFTANGTTRRAAWLVHDFLFALDANNVPRPQMLEKYMMSADGLTHSFTLRSGLKFHDGSPVTSADAIASIKRWASKDGAGQSMLGSVTEMTAVDDREFVIKTSRKYTKFPAAFSKLNPYLPIIVPKRLAETPASQAMAEVIGAGPYRFVPQEFVAGSKVVYTKFDGFVPRSEPVSGLAGGKIANFKRIEVINVTDPQTVFAALSAGEIDVVIAPPADFVPLMRADPNITVTVNDKLGALGYVRMNWLHPPFNDVRARKAVQWLINQKDYLAAAAGSPENYVECRALFVCGSTYGSEDGAIVGPDLAKAKQLLAEAGYKGEPIVLLVSTDLPSLKAAGLVLAQELRAAGMKLDVQEMDTPTVAQRTQNKAAPAQGGWNIYTNYAVGMILSDPMVTEMSAACEKAVSGWPCDQKFEELRKAFDTADSEDEAKKIAKEMQVRGTEIGISAPWGIMLLPTAMRSDLTGMLAGPGTEVFWNIRRK